MSVFSGVLLAVVSMAQGTEPYAAITIGALPADNGICVSYAAGSPDSTFMDKGAAYSYDLVCNAKHESQQAAQDALAAIHVALTQATVYPIGEKWQITNIETIAAPSYLSREQNKQWLYGSSLRVKFYHHKEG